MATRLNPYLSFKGNAREAMDFHHSVFGGELTRSTFAGMGETTPNSSISLSGEDEAELRGYWDNISGSVEVTLPLNEAPWGDSFGMCVDKFGVRWMVNITGSRSWIRPVPQRLSYVDR